MGSSDSKIEAALNTAPLTVIVGGGYGGIAVARGLDKICNVIVIEKKNFLFHNLGAPRAIAKNDYAINTIIPYDKTLKFGNILMNTSVVSLTNKSVTISNESLDSNVELKFDYLVLATGSSYGFPLKTEYSNYKDVMMNFDNIGKLIKEKDNILIVGGGATGCEIAGEICENYPNKKVTIVHSRDTLLSTLPNKGLGQEILKRIKDSFKNCQVILGDRVELPKPEAKADDAGNNDDGNNEEKGADNEEVKIEPNQSNNVQETGFIINDKKPITTKNGKELKDIDLIFFCTGVKVNKGIYKNTPFESIMNEEGRIKTKNTMQVDFSDSKDNNNYDNVFAVGDISAFDMKLAYFAGENAKIVIANITKLIKGQTLKTTENHGSASFVTLGSQNGAALVPMGKNGKVIGSFIVKKMKGADLMAARTWKESGGYDRVVPVTDKYPAKPDGDAIKKLMGKYKKYFVDVSDDVLTKLFTQLIWYFFEKIYWQI